MQKELQRFKVQENKIQYTPPYVDHSKFNRNSIQTDIYKKLNISKNVKILLTTRRLTSRTGVIKFVKMYKKIRKKISFETIFLIGGKGEQVKEIKALEDQYVKYLGFIPESIIADIYKITDLYVLPSTFLEGFGYVILESFACGTPVIASQSAGGGKEFIEKIDANLIFNFDEISLLNSINYALQNYSTEEKKEMLYTISNDYGIKKLAKIYMNK